MPSSVSESDMTVTFKDDKIHYGGNTESSEQKNGIIIDAILVSAASKRPYV
ncbi:hypothetical protein [Moritella sp. JT01]|uniref:hypothetical protein n=1 Tax=Moritella sp. JT01 TaxID=756698 RepID=UPI000A85C56D|nr:hypothetical protein [Moritella sp. JT01]